ncbi:hypothetical protein GCM10011297_19960 [Bacterioplanes sanyensis]|uniref:GGDEF domain-containing protein n=1 Tax=Bacterioplanes sanyensis TaxID=1249553 RepID=UPI0019A9DF08|nr:GGDEF domain-containing protein [Bacterioplanes sanyensis]GGY47017.1 hypothetical protein GCM10011297_19960 [Bacterioplanes sanyensis]
MSEGHTSDSAPDAMNRKTHSSPGALQPQMCEPRCPVGESHCAIIDELMELRQLVVTDPLTGLFNVRHFTAALEQELERTQRTGIATALMMIDLDFFKRVNDDWGHEAGNRVLRGTANCIRDNTRKLDVQCRYGGEEFAVILPTTERRLAIQVAERVRAAIAEAVFYADDEQQQAIPVTASIGLAWHGNGQWHTRQSLVEEADAQLYRAKESGRNRVCYAQAGSQVAVSQGEKDLLHDLFAPADDEAQNADADDDSSWDFDGSGH